MPEDMCFALEVGRPFTSKSLLNLKFASRTEFRIVSKVGRNQAITMRLSRYEDDEREM